MSEPSASYAALIPALDCAATIADLVRGCREHVARVLVVDDGSADATAEEARSAGAEVFAHGENLGKGAALVSGLRYLQERGFTYAISLDGDGQHFAAEIPNLLAESRGNELFFARPQIQPKGLVGEVSNAAELPLIEREGVLEWIGRDQVRLFTHSAGS